MGGQLELHDLPRSVAGFVRGNKCWQCHTGFAQLSISSQKQLASRAIIIPNKRAF